MVTLVKDAAPCNGGSCVALCYHTYSNGARLWSHRCVIAQNMLADKKHDDRPNPGKHEGELP